jgi:hypothetical protein
MKVTLSPSTPNRTINIEIVEDRYLEGMESFILKLNFTNDGGETHRLNLKQPNTTVIIIDNDSKFWVLSFQVCILELLILIGLTIDFSRTSYTVNENDGEVTLTVEVDSTLSTLNKEISLNITAHDGSATGTCDSASFYV